MMMSFNAINQLKFMQNSSVGIIIINNGNFVSIIIIMEIIMIIIIK